MKQGTQMVVIVMTKEQIEASFEDIGEGCLSDYLVNELENRNIQAHVQEVHGVPEISASIDKLING